MRRAAGGGHLKKSAFAAVPARPQGPVETAAKAGGSDGRHIRLFHIADSSPALQSLPEKAVSYTAPFEGVPMLTIDQAKTVLDSAATAAKLALAVSGAAPVNTMLLRPATFLAVLKADPALIQWKRGRDLQHVPMWADLRIEISDDLLPGRRVEKTLGPIGRGFVPAIPERRGGFVAKVARW